MHKELDQSGQTHSLFRKAIPCLYLLTLAAMAVIVTANILFKDSDESKIGLENFTTMNQEWYTAGGNQFAADNIDQLPTTPSGYVPLYHKLPPQQNAAQSIIFRSKNCFVSVWIDNVKIYETDVTNAPFYNHSPGTRWNIVSIRPENAGGTLELRITQAYQDGRAKVDNFYTGDRAAIVLHLIQSKLGGFVISLLIFFVGILFFGAWIVLNWKRSVKDSSLLWLAAFAAIASTWCMVETNLFQLFSIDLRLIQVVDNMMLVIGGLPLYLYLDSVYKVFQSRLLRILCGLNVAYLLLSTLSQILGLWDYHQTLNGAITTYGIFIIVLAVCLVKERGNSKSSPGENKHLFYLLQTTGILALGIGLLCDLFNYLTTDVLDRAFFIRIGLLSFIICFGAGNIYQMIILVQKGMESDFISQLAYIDGLTKIGNRTAYVEKLDYLQRMFPADSLGLVMFDINNLKIINDSFGHKAGDELILKCADILRASFSPAWDIFRIGGDEFVAIRYGENIHASYENAAALFAREISARNRSGKNDFCIEIAQGAAFSQIITAKTIEKAEKEADQLMYRNKHEMKSNKC